MDVLKDETRYEAAVLGGGPAGMTAAVYLARKNIKHIVISPDFGGQVNWTAGVENYMGYRMIEGRTLMEKFFGQVKEFSIPLSDDTAAAVSAGEQGFAVTCVSGRIFRAGTVIMATGKRPRTLGVPGEKELTGRGVAYCATCDAPLFRGVDVAVVGGGNSALTSVMDLISYAKKVYVLNNIDRLIADPVLIEKAESSGKVEFYNNVRVTGIKGDKRVEALTAELEGGKKEFALSGIFIEIGLSPNSGPVKGFLKLNGTGEIEINSSNESSVPGIFAAGDVTDVPEKQIIIAAGEGAKAALSAVRYLRRK